VRRLVLPVATVNSSDLERSEVSAWLDERLGDYALIEIFQVLILPGADIGSISRRPSYRLPLRKCSSPWKRSLGCRETSRPHYDEPLGISAVVTRFIDRGVPIDQG